MSLWILKSHFAQGFIGPCHWGQSLKALSCSVILCQSSSAERRPTCRTTAACLLNDWRVAESGWSATEANPGAPRLAWPLHRSTSPPASLSNTDWRQGADYCSRTPIAQNCLKCQQHSDGDVVMVVLTSAWLTDYLAVNKKVENSFQKIAWQKKFLW